MTHHSYLGIDVGSTTVKGVVLSTGSCIDAAHIVPVSGNYQADVAALIDRLGNRDRFDAVVATGYGQDLVEGAERTLSEISCHARGIAAQLPGTELVIDIGGQDVKAIWIGPGGRPLNFQMNDKCAAGTGRFLDVMARALGVDVDGFSDLAANARGSVKINNMCTVFAESEVITLLSRGVPQADVANGLLNTIAGRIAGLAKRLGKADSVALSGGVALNPTIARYIADHLGQEVVVPAEPQLAGAYGAALIAAELAAKQAGQT